MNVKTATIATALVLGAVAFGITACNDHAANTPSVTTSTTSDVVYKVTGTAKTVNLTLQTPSGIAQQNGLPVPVKNKLGQDGLHTTMPVGAFTYISAQNQSAYGTVTCSIEIDGVVIATNTSSGGYSIATCQG